LIPLIFFDKRKLIKAFSVIILLAFPCFTAALHSLDSEITESGKETRQLNIFPAHPVITAYTWEMHSTVNRFEFLKANKAPPQYPWAEGFTDRVFLNIQLGADIPVIGGENGEWLWYIGLPVSFDMTDDFFEPETAPVMNTDYWFGIRFESLYRISAKWPENISIRILPIYHESTHIGDETALGMSYDNPTDFYRINVSYEAWEILIGLDEWESGRGNSFNLRLGLSGHWNADGYYSSPLQGELGTSLHPSDIIPSRGILEYFGQFNTVIESGFPSIGSWVFQGGFELRNNILPDYFSTEKEERIWTINASIGWYRYSRRLNARRIGFYLRFLGGQNPHGQFREQDGYSEFGAGISMGL